MIINARTLKSAACEFFNVEKTNTGRLSVSAAECLIDRLTQHSFLVRKYSADPAAAADKYISIHMSEIESLVRRGMKQSKYTSAAKKIRARARELAAVIANAPTAQEVEAARIFRRLISKRAGRAIYGFSSYRRIVLDCAF